jgi:hypothetical protein
MDPVQKDDRLIVTLGVGTYVVRLVLLPVTLAIVLVFFDWTGNSVGYALTCIAWLVCICWNTASLSRPIGKGRLVIPRLLIVQFVSVGVAYAMLIIWIFRNMPF